MERRIHTTGPGTYGWRKTFALVPRTTITNNRVWLETLFVRRVLAEYGPFFHVEPEKEYATLFDILAYDTES